MSRVAAYSVPVVLFLLALLLRMAYCESTQGLGHFSDRGYTEYVVAGGRLLEGGTIVSPLIRERTPTEPSALLPPGYTALVAGVYAWWGVETTASTAVLQVINAIALALSALLAYDLARRLAGPTAALSAGLIATINPLLIGFTDYVWDTGLFALGVTLGVWFSWYLSQARRSLWAWLGFGLYLGALALLNPALTITYPLLVLWPLLRTRGGGLGTVVRGVLLTVVGWLIAIAPWTIRNYVQFDELIYVRGGFALELWLGVCPEADAHGADVYSARFPLNSADVQRRIAEIGERAFITECGRQARAAITADPWRSVRLVAVRCVDYWGGTVFTHGPPGGGGWPRSAGRAAIALFMLLELVIFAVAIAVCFRRRIALPGACWWLLAIIASFSLVYCLTHVQVRFRAPMEPVVAVLLAVVMTAAAGKIRGAVRTPLGASMSEDGASEEQPA